MWNKVKKDFVYNTHMMNSYNYLHFAFTSMFCIKIKAL